MEGIIPPNQGSPLYYINKKNNDKIIEKLEIAIRHIIVKNICVPYRRIKTGLTLFLFHIHNIIIMNNITKFDINAYSFCDIDKRIKFYIYFKKSKAKCNFNNVKFCNVNKYYSLEITINAIKYMCKLKERCYILNTIFPIIKDFKCENNPKSTSKKIYVNGLPSKFWIPPLNNGNITNIFIVSRIAKDKYYKKIFIIGRLYDNLEINLNYFFN